MSNIENTPSPQSQGKNTTAVIQCCPVCASDDIGVMGTASWDINSQTWVLSSTYEEDFFCRSCDCEFTTPIAKPASGEEC